MLIIDSHLADPRDPSAEVQQRLSYRRSIMADNKLNGDSELARSWSHNAASFDTR